ncbi:helix-turn-helix domain-containing protein [Actinomyces succiniciruminis]|uniref:helix-turn-helix domain-containing protein n=1 Tax=Actinomyces succiniciruminis TaxID=1522002 RepID=UPI003CC7D972
MHDRGDDGYITPSQAAALLPGTSVDSIRRWIRTGALAARKLPNGRYLVRRMDVEGLLLPVDASPPSSGELPGQEALL